MQLAEKESRTGRVRVGVPSKACAIQGILLASVPVSCAGVDSGGV